MKNKWCLVLLSAGIASCLKADLRDNASWLLSNYVLPQDPLNGLADKFRLSLQAVHYGKSFLGFQGYGDLCSEYALPPVGAVPASVMQKLVTFQKTKVASAGENLSDDAPLRSGVGLGKQEQVFIQNRLVYAQQFFKPCPISISNSQVMSPFIGIPDVDYEKIRPDLDYEKIKPYGYALTTGIKSASTESYDPKTEIDHESLEPQSVPRIAVCLSGGGFRAMTASLGFWKAMSDTGMVGSVLYHSNLSGSTWCSIPWCVGATLKDLEDTYSKYAKVKVGTTTAKDINTYIKPHTNTAYLKDKLTSSFLWNQPLSSIRGVWGPLIAQMTLSFWDDKELGDNKYQSCQYLYLWQALDVIADGTQRPFPIATALIPFQSQVDTHHSAIAKQQKADNGLWMEFNPEYVGFEYFSNGNRSGAWAPSFALGRQFTTEITATPKRWYRIFQNNKTIGWESEAAPAQTLDYWAGTWGSAFTVAPKDIYRIFYGASTSTDTTVTGISKNDEGNSIAGRLIGYFGSVIDPIGAVGSVSDAAKNVRLFPAKFNNFAVFSDSPFKDSTTITAVDAGIDFNLPFPPLLRSERDIDLIIVGDWSPQESDFFAKELVLAERWAKKQNTPVVHVAFPIIENSLVYQQIKKSLDENKSVALPPMILFNEFEDGQSGPAILYIPLIDNDFNDPDFSIDTCLKGACSTFNFNYSPDDIQKLSDHVYRTIWGVYPQIREVVQNLVLVKNGSMAGEQEVARLTSLTPLDQLTMGDTAAI